jgi:uncharacterized protein (TIGR01319 family)
MQRIVEAKGLNKAKELVNHVIMPTPVAVLNAAVVLSQGTEGLPGMGELIVVDVGGATTDIYSIARGNPTKRAAMLKGLPEPYAKRTVEGDLGVRHNIDTLADICTQKGITVDCEVLADFHADASRTPTNDREAAVDTILTRIAVETSFERHVGKIETVYGSQGEMLIQVGKDLSEVKIVIGTGGPITHSSAPAEILKGVLAESENGNLLKPHSADFYLDRDYIMYAMGLLSQSAPKAALKILKEHLKRV